MKIIGSTTFIEPEKGNIFVKINDKGEYTEPRRVLTLRNDATVESLGYSEILMTDFAHAEMEKRKAKKAESTKRDTNMPPEIETPVEDNTETEEKEIPVKSDSPTELEVTDTE